MGYVSNPNQQPNNAILDYFNKQIYLGNEYSLGLNGVTLSGTDEVPFALIKNPVGNSKAIFIAKFSLAADDEVFLRYYANPTISDNGTPEIPANLRIASDAQSTSICYTAPTISSNGTFLFCIGLSSSGASIVQNSLQAIIDAGNSVLITAQAATSNTSIIHSTIFYEV